MCIYMHITSCFEIVPQASLDISESTEGSVSGLTHTLTCTATLANGVLPSLVTISWSGGSLSQSPRVIVSDQTTNGSHYTRTVTFSPLLYNDAGQYSCSVLVDGFDEAQHSDDVMVAVNGMSNTCNLLSKHNSLKFIVSNCRSHSLKF